MIDTSRPASAARFSIASLTLMGSIMAFAVMLAVIPGHYFIRFAGFTAPCLE